MIIGHIGVRAGSKGLSDKNMKIINGKPLLEWSLQHLLDHPLIDTVVVSTDGQKYLDFSIEKGALDIGLRPDYLATDTASKWNVWEHALDQTEKVAGIQADIFLDLDATSPLRIPQDITDAITLFKTKKPDMVMSCTEARKNPYFNLVEPDETGALHVSKPLPNNVVARQQAPTVYEHAASTYVLDPDYLRRASSLYEGRVIPYLMPADRCFDIDSPEDFEYVEFLMKKRGIQ